MQTHDSIVAPKNASRRAFLKSAAAVSAFPIAGVAEVAVAEETPVAKTTRLGWELADALNDYADGTMHAEIYPSSQRGQFSVGFKIDYPETQEEKVKRLIRNLQFEMAKLPVIETTGGLAHELRWEGKSWLRLSKSQIDERDVFVGFPPALTI